jgi:IS30 family transposase
MEGLSLSAWKAITFEQGSEFAYYRLLEQHNEKCTIYFLCPPSPWKRGTNENTNGKVRSFLPRSHNVAQLEQFHIANLAKKLNNILSKIFNYLTPREALQQHTHYVLSHFKLE